MNATQESPVCPITLAVPRRSKENERGVQKSNVSSTRLTFAWWWEEGEMRIYAHANTGQTTPNNAYLPRVFEVRRQHNVPVLTDSYTTVMRRLVLQ